MAYLTLTIPSDYVPGEVAPSAGWTGADNANSSRPDRGITSTRIRTDRIAEMVDYRFTGGSPGAYTAASRVRLILDDRTYNTRDNNSRDIVRPAYIDIVGGPQATSTVSAAAALEALEPTITGATLEAEIKRLEAGERQSCSLSVAVTTNISIPVQLDEGDDT